MEEAEIGTLIKKINDKMRTQADAVFRNYDLTFSQVRVLHFVREAGGSATQKEIGQHLCCSHPTVVGLVSRLEKNGFLETLKDETDRRNKLVRLTKKAVQTEKSLKARKEAIDARLTENLSEQEREELLWLLKLLYSGME